MLNPFKQRLLNSMPTILEVLYLASSSKSPKINLNEFKVKVRIQIQKLFIQYLRQHLHKLRNTNKHFGDKTDIQV